MPFQAGLNHQVSLYLGFLFSRKGAVLPLLASRYPQFDGFATPLQVALPNSAGVANADSDTFCQNIVLHPCIIDEVITNRIDRLLQNRAYLMLATFRIFAIANICH